MIRVWSLPLFTIGTTVVDDFCCEGEGWVVGSASVRHRPSSLTSSFAMNRRKQCPLLVSVIAKVSYLGEGVGCMWVVVLTLRTFPDASPSLAAAAAWSLIASPRRVVRAVAWCEGSPAPTPIPNPTFRTFGVSTICPPLEWLVNVRVVARATHTHTRPLLCPSIAPTRRPALTFNAPLMRVPYSEVVRAAMVSLHRVNCNDRYPLSARAVRELDVRSARLFLARCGAVGVCNTARVCDERLGVTRRAVRSVLRVHLTRTVERISIAVRVDFADFTPLGFAARTALGGPRVTALVPRGVVQNAAAPTCGTRGVGGNIVAGPGRVAESGVG